jgi:hypothetical protein
MKDSVEIFLCCGVSVAEGYGALKVLASFGQAIHAGENGS